MKRKKRQENITICFIVFDLKNGKSLSDLPFLDNVS